LTFQPTKGFVAESEIAISLPSLHLFTSAPHFGSSLRLLTSALHFISSFHLFIPSLHFISSCARRPAICVISSFGTESSPKSTGIKVRRLATNSCTSFPLPIHHLPPSINLPPTCHLPPTTIIHTTTAYSNTHSNTQCPPLCQVEKQVSFVHLVIWDLPLTFHSTALLTTTGLPKPTSTTPSTNLNQSSTSPTTPSKGATHLSHLKLVSLQAHLQLFCHTLTDFANS
jgi:hypothetical protein